jgi:hypothetical protein
VDNPVCGDEKRYKYHPMDRHASPCRADGGSGGMFSNSKEMNPVMFNWNKVFIGYCDGSSFSSKNPSVVVPSRQDGRVSYGGHFILDAIYDMLLNQHGLISGSDVVIAGSSAGGLSVVIHIDYLHHKITSRSKVSPKPVIVGVVDGGYFMDYPSLSGESKISGMYKDITATQNVTLNKACQVKHIANKEGKVHGLLPRAL